MLELKKIHEDERGEIYSIPLSEHTDIAILVTNKGYARGGHYHPESDEYFIVVKGLVKYIIDERKEFYHTGLSDVVMKGEPHMFVSHSDSIVLHFGADEKQSVKYDEYRKIVEEINKGMKTDG
jgi:quercetin dioxygenase-like cupin family protein